MSLRNFSLIIFSSMLFLAAAACQNAGEPDGPISGQGYTYELLSKSAFEKRLGKENGYLLVDVRRPEEYEAGHIEGAININFLEPPVFEEQFSRIDTTQTLMIYCRSGKRSMRSAKKLQEMGFKKIYDLEGGYLNWQERE